MAPIACPAGFLANGVRAGIKPSGKPDLTLIRAPKGATAAAMLTRNLVRAAPLEITAKHLAASAHDIRALLINAGCANAATGAEGMARAERSVTLLAHRLECSATQVLVNSTGVIGQQLPIERIEAAIPALVDGADAEGLVRAAEAIMTTDTRIKIVSIDAGTSSAPFRVTGIAKGAGMIHPDLAPAVPHAPPHATMIVALLTDAVAAPESLQAILAAACERSVHRISIDGDTSTNDAVFALASGVSGHDDRGALGEAIAEALRQLAMAIVRDGEGAKKLIHVEVTGATDQPDALRVARTVATSMLVRTAVAGGDANWGRLLAAIGRSGARVDLAAVRVQADGVELYARGGPVAITAAQRGAIFKGEHVAISIDLALGHCRDEFFTCDLTEEYVRVNAEYTT